MRKRTLAREYVLKILYQAEICSRKISLAVDLFWEDHTKVHHVVKNFAQELLKGIDSNLDEIDDKITACATNWQLKRMAVIDRNILRIGVYELFFADKIPPKVSINEAVELAKKFGDLESSKFINGILDKLHKSAPS